MKKLTHNRLKNLKRLLKKYDVQIDADGTWTCTHLRYSNKSVYIGKYMFHVIESRPCFTFGQVKLP